MEESNLNKRILGIDYGKIYCGVAISDPLLVTAGGLETIERKRPDKQRKLLARLSEICDEYNVSSIVIGLPKNLDGTENERCEFTYEFANLLFKRVNIPIYLWDERLSTVSSDKDLSLMGIKDKKPYSDEMAAMYILQGFLDSIKHGVVNVAYLS